MQYLRSNNSLQPLFTGKNNVGGRGGGGVSTPSGKTLYGGERDHLVSAISSTVNVRSHGDITTLTAAAATTLRGATTLKARALKEVWNIAAMIPVEKGVEMRMSGSVSSNDQTSHTNGSDLHWKIVSVYIHRTDQVMLKMKSMHVAETITKKKKSVVLEVRRDVASWPGRHLFEDGEQRRYFGLKTATCGVVEFECKNQKEYDVWTQGVSRLLSITAERKNKCHK
ncbi:VAN3-binding protein [Camellia lanceoleosa]|uniref:VAN3-binding protein n=1 Tax=Camellia lanceoleosa TaxID=1840588 RepID=A0ACC0IY71_9ERIC|nr:VAN3-binding protein [Camellia lanceoleosa]